MGRILLLNCEHGAGYLSTLSRDDGQICDNNATQTAIDKDKPFFLILSMAL